MVETPAGIVLSRDEAFGILRVIRHVDDDMLNQVSDRIRRYLDSDWQVRAEQRAQAVDKWNPHPHSQRN